MNINPQQPSFPYEGSGMPDTIGISIRSHFASLAMQGMLSNPKAGSRQLICECAVEFADALIAELNKEQP